MAKSRTRSAQFEPLLRRPESVFELGYYDSPEETQEWLNLAPFGTPPVIHLPSNSVVCAERDTLAASTSIRTLDILLAYHRLHRSAQCSDIICGEVDNSGNKCGGIMDEEVSAFGVYYLCRKNTRHKFAK